MIGLFVICSWGIVWLKGIDILVIVVSMEMENGEEDVVVFSDFQPFFLNESVI